MAVIFEVGWKTRPPLKFLDFSGLRPLTPSDLAAAELGPSWPKAEVGPTLTLV